MTIVLRMASNDQQDAELIGSIAGGDRTAFEKLYFAYQKRLFGYLYRTLGDAGAAEELVNDVMVEVWKSAKRYRRESKPSTWIFAIAHHRMLNRLRRPRRDTADLDLVSGAASGENPEREVIRGEMYSTVRQALNELPEQQREVVELTFRQGCSYNEIARIVDCPLNTVKTRMFHAKKKLLETLQRLGVGGGGGK